MDEFTNIFERCSTSRSGTKFQVRKIVLYEIMVVILSLS